MGPLDHLIRKEMCFEEDEASARIVGEFVDLCFRIVGYDYAHINYKDNLGYAKFTKANKRCWYVRVNPGFYFRGPIYW